MIVVCLGQQLICLIMVSVIIPVYNKEKSIFASVASVLSQTYTDFELLIVNDGSTDKSMFEVSKFKDERIRIINQQNQGVSVARNKGISEAKGEWILFLDADDLILPYCLDELLRVQKKYGTSIVTGNFFIMDEQGKLTTYLHHSMCGLSRNNFRNLFFERFYLRMGNSLLRRDMLLHNRFDERLSRYEDFELFFKIVRKFKVAVLPREICIHTYKFSDLACCFSYPERDYITHIKMTDKSFWEKMNLSLLLHEGYRYKEYEGLLHLTSCDRRYVWVARMMQIPVRAARKFHKFLD